LKKEVKFQWNEHCQQSLHTLKQKLVIAPILVFLDWKKDFHVHVDESSIMLGIVLAHLGEGYLDNPISFSSRRLSTTENNYTTIEREGLAMVYALQKFRNYLLGSHFNMYTNHYALRYLINNPMLEEENMQMVVIFPILCF